jgi:hypothetical protein
MIPEEIYKFLSERNIYVTPATEDYILRSALRIIEHHKMWEHLPSLEDEKVRNEYLPPLCSILLLRATEIGVSINLDREIYENKFIPPLKITVRDAQISALTSKCMCPDTGDPETHWPKNDLMYVVSFSGELFRLKTLLEKLGIQQTPIGLLIAIKEYGVTKMMEMKYDEINTFGPKSLKLKNWFKIKMEIWNKIAEIIVTYKYFREYEIYRK